MFFRYGKRSFTPSNPVRPYISVSRTRSLETRFWFHAREFSDAGSLNACLLHASFLSHPIHAGSLQACRPNYLSLQVRIKYQNYDTAEAGKNRLLLFKTFYFKLCVLQFKKKISKLGKSSLIESVCLSLSNADDVTKEDIIGRLWGSEDVIREGRAAHGCVAWVGIKMRVRAALGCVTWPKLTSKLYKYFRNPVA